MSKAYESDLEQALVSLLSDMNYECLAGDSLAPESGAFVARGSYHDVLLSFYLRNALEKINPAIPEHAREEAINKLTDTVFTDLVQENRRIHELLVNGVDVSFLHHGETRAFSR